VPEKKQNEPVEGMNLTDIYFIVFRQKWIILFCSALGCLAAAALFVVKPAQYQSEAKLLVRYVLEEHAPIQGTGDPTTLQWTDPSVLNTEIQILGSLDVANQVVANLGAKTILGSLDGAADTNLAAALLLKGLNAEPSTKDHVIPITFQHPDPVVAQSVLHEVIMAYLKKHDEMHNPLAMSNDTLRHETDRLRAELEKIDLDLKRAKADAGVITSIDEAKKAKEQRIGRINEELIAAEAELAERRAITGQIPKPPLADSSTNAQPAVAPGVLRDYNTVCASLGPLMQKERDLVIKYGDKSLFVRDIRDQIADAEKTKKKLEDANPGLAALEPESSVPVATPPGSADFATELQKVRGLEARTNNLRAQLRTAMAEESAIESAEPKILDLLRRRDRTESNFKYFSQKLDDSSTIGKGSEEIKIVQSPSPPVKQRSKKFKKAFAIVLAGGFGGGFALAFLIEMFLDRSIKRPVEVERKLRLPLFMSFPDTSQNGHRALKASRNQLLLNDASSNASLAVVDAGPNTGENDAGIAPWDRRHSLQRYYAGLRDRLIVNFELRSLMHHPKLVAVTSCGRGAGVSSIAAGLAASLSETGEGNVLLVDMNLEQSAARQFYKGRPGCGLDDALENETMGNAHVRDNLYVASEQLGNEKLPRVLPRRFATLMPKLKASDYDYIIFDLPPVSQTSMTPRLAGLMDMVLLVIEAEKTNQDVVKRATALLAESKANVSAVLNKARTYIPQQLHQGLPDEV
jgi:uncharacterized protein involved in exopolysaccharide biosynthesis/Mrp family chromosome partitioning ATPase